MLRSRNAANCDAPASGINSQVTGTRFGSGYFSFAAGFGSLLDSLFVSAFLPLSLLDDEQLDDESLAGLSAEAAFL